MPLHRALTSSNVSGLGTAATRNTGTSGANVPLFSTGGTWGAAMVIDYALPSLTFNNSGTGTYQIAISADQANHYANIHQFLTYGSAQLAILDTNGLDVPNLIRCNSLRIDQAASTSGSTATHKITVSANGTNYDLLCVAST